MKLSKVIVIAYQTTIVYRFSDIPRGLTTNASYGITSNISKFPINSRIASLLLLQIDSYYRCLNPIYYVWVVTFAKVANINTHNQSLRGGEFDKSTWSNPLLSPPIPIQRVVGLTIGKCITILHDKLPLSVLY